MSSQSCGTEEFQQEETERTELHKKPLNEWRARPWISWSATFRSLQRKYGCGARTRPELGIGTVEAE
jgi:hypothetical protein